MKVVFVGCLGPEMTRPSGVSNYVNSILAELPKIGIEASLIGAGPAADANLTYEFIPVSTSSGLTSLGFLMRLVSSTAVMSLPEEPIINAHRPDDMIPFHLLRKRNPKIITLHGTHFLNVYIKRGRLAGKAYDLMEKYSVNRTRHLISVSKAARDLFLRRFPDEAKCIHHIPPGVDTELFRPWDRLRSRKSFGFGDDDYIVLYAGRLAKEKRVDLLLRAFFILKKRRPKAKLVIAGEGSERVRLEALTSAGKVRDVLFLGNVPQVNMPKLMSGSDVFCLLSLHEGFPSVVLESLACGLPVVSTAVGDIPDVVSDGSSGAILEDLQPKHIAEKLLQVGAIRDSLESKCVRVASSFSWRKTARLTSKVYEEVLGNAG